MPIRPCPNCKNPAPHIVDRVITDAVVNYYRCDECGHVWNTPKDRPEAKAYIVTQGRRQYA